MTVDRIIVALATHSRSFYQDTLLILFDVAADRNGNLDVSNATSNMVHKLY